MNWSEIQALYDGQGLVFWTAVAAVTLGLTLLSVSIVFQLRKIFVQARNNRRTGNEKQVVIAPRGVVEATPDGYKPGVLTPPATPVRAPDELDPLLTGVLARLKASADHLEQIHRSLGSQQAAAGVTTDSLLKEPAEEVDYVYQAARA